MSKSGLIFQSVLNTLLIIIFLQYIYGMIFNDIMPSKFFIIIVFTIYSINILLDILKDWEIYRDKK
jgi:Kef-type K+ transport system membrane component KefB